MTDLLMKKTPSALKWLAEKRARIAHDLAQTERIASDILKKRDGLRLDLAALDRSLTLYDPAIDPSAIAAVNGWKGNYGRRGNLQETIIEILKEQAPEWVPTGNIELLLCMKLQLDFDSPALRKRWYDNSFRKVLKNLVAQGLAERQQDPVVFTGEVGRWRWKQEGAKTLAELRSAIGLLGP